MASPARHAFAPLSAFIEASSISRSVQTRATTLYSSARSKTGLGSGNELPGNVAGNANAIAAACLMLAQMEAEGSSQVDQDAYQRQSSTSKPLFKKLVSSLQGVLSLKAGAAAAAAAAAASNSESSKKTPTRSSVRKRNAEAAQLDNEDTDDPRTTTPTKSSRTTASKSTTITTGSASRTPTRSGTARSSRVEELASGRTSGSAKRKLEEDMDEHTSTSGSGASPSRRSTRVVGTSSAAKPRTKGTIPTKKGRPAGAAIQAEENSAFEAALRKTTPNKSAAASTSAAGPSSKKIAKAGSAIPIVTEAMLAVEREEDEGEQEVPYEPYLDDLLRKWRTSAVRSDGDGKERARTSWWDVKREDMENWRMEMLERLEVEEMVA